MLGPRPSAVTAPSTWYAAVAVPHMNPGGKSFLLVTLAPSCVVTVIGGFRGRISRSSAETLWSRRMRSVHATPLAHLGDRLEDGGRCLAVAALRGSSGRAPGAP